MRSSTSAPGVGHKREQHLRLRDPLRYNLKTVRTRPRVLLTDQKKKSWILPVEYPAGARQVKEVGIIGRQK